MLINFILFIYVITFISYLHDYIRYSGRWNVDVDKFDIIYLHDYITFPGNGILCTLREAGFKRRAFINKRLVTYGTDGSLCISAKIFGTLH